MAITYNQQVLVVNAASSTGITACRTSDGTLMVQVGTNVYRSTPQGGTPTAFTQVVSTLNNYYARSQCAHGNSIRKLGFSTVGMNTNLGYYDITSAGSVGSFTDMGYSFDLFVAFSGAAIAKDSNGRFHVVFFDSVASMGTEYITLYYTNDVAVAGTFKTPVEIIGVSAQEDQLSNINIGITVNSGNIPICTWIRGNNGNRSSAKGNANNATSFTIGTIFASGGTWRPEHIASDTTNGSSYTLRNNAGQLDLYEQTSGVTTWSNSLNDTGKTYTWIFGYHIHGNSLYVFFKDNTNNSTGISIAEIDITTSGSPSVVGYTENTDINPQSGTGIFHPGHRYENYGSDDTDHNTADTKPELDVILNTSTSLLYWTEWIFPSSALVGEINTQSKLTHAGYGINQGFNMYIGSYERFGQYIPGYQGYLNTIKVRMYKNGSPVHDIFMQIWDIVGGNPNTVLATSQNSVAAASLLGPGSYTELTFAFDGAWYSQDIAIIININQNVTTSNASNSVTAAGANDFYWNVGGVRRYNGTWSSLTSHLQFIINDGGAWVTGTLTAKGALVGRTEQWLLENTNTGSEVFSYNGSNPWQAQLLPSFQGTIKQVQFRFRKQGSPDHGIRVKIYSDSAGQPGTLLQTSQNVIQATSVLTSHAYYTFGFIPTYYSQTIHIVLEQFNFITSDGANRLIISISQEASFPIPGNRSQSNDGSAWTTVSTSDMTYILSVQSTLGVLAQKSNNPIVGNIDALATVDGILTAKGNILGSIDATATTISVLSANGILLGSIDITPTVDGTLSGRGNIESIINALATVEGILLAKGTLESLVNANAVIEGILTAKGDLLVTVNAGATVDGTLTNAVTIGPIEGLINALATVQGLLSGKGALIGSVDITPTVQGLLTATGNMVVVSNGQATVDGLLTAIGSLLGEINGLATIDGTLSALGQLESAINGLATVDGTLNGLGQLQAIINALATVDGTLSAQTSLSSTVNANATIQGILTAIGQLQGTINAGATVQGAMALNALIGTINGLVTVQGILTAIGSLSSSSDGQATVQGFLTGKGSLVGSIDITPTVQGLLSGKGALVGSVDIITHLSNMVSAWKLDGDSIDSLNQYDGVNTNITYVAGKIGNAARFNGANSYINMGYASQLDLSTELSISAWINLDLYPAGGGVICTWVSAGFTTYPFHYVIQANGLIRFNANNNPVDGLTQIPIGTWQHVAVTRDASGLVKHYLNGVLDNSGNQTVPAGPVTGENIFTIGRKDAQYFDGNIDDIAISSKVWSEAEIKFIVEQGNLGVSIADLSGTYGKLTGKGALVGQINTNNYLPELVSYWPLDSNSIDGIGNNDGTDTSVTYEAGGIISNRANFLVSTAKIVIPDNGSLAISGPFTISVWVRLSSLRDSWIFNKLTAFDTTREYYLVYQHSTLKWIFAMYDQTNAVSLTNNADYATMVINTWYHVAVTWDGTNAEDAIKIYVNKEKIGLSANQPTFSSVTNNNHPVTIGLSPHSGISYLSGWLDEIMWMNREYSHEEINYIYNQTIGGVAGNLINGGVYGNLSAILTNTLSGQIDALATVQGILTAKGALLGSSNGLATIDGLLNIKRSDIEGLIQGLATVDGTLTAMGQLVGQSDGQATIQGLGILKKQLEGVINAFASVNGDLTPDGKMKARSNSYASAVGLMTAIGQLLGTINAGATVKGGINEDSMYGKIFGYSTVTGWLTARTPISGTTDGLASLSGILHDARGQMKGLIQGYATVEGYLSATVPMLGSVNARAYVTGILNGLDIQESCSYSVFYVKQPKFKVTYIEQPQFDIEHISTKFVVTFDCQKIVKCKP